MSSDKENRDKDISSMLSAVEEALKHDSRRTMFEFVDGVLVPYPPHGWVQEEGVLVPDPQYKPKEVKPEECKKEDEEVYRLVKGTVHQTYFNGACVSQWFEAEEEKGWRDRYGNTINRPPDLITYPELMQDPCD